MGENQVREITEVVRNNKELGHTYLERYDSVELADSRERKYHLSLKGLWKLRHSNKNQLKASNRTTTIDNQEQQIAVIDSEDNPVGVYYNSFTMPDHWKEQNIYIYFGAVQSNFYLWVNGVKVGWGQATMTSVEFNLSPYIEAGTNSVAVEVYYNNSDRPYLGKQTEGFLTGICRDVFLYAEPKQFIWDCFATSIIKASYSQAKLKVKLTMRNTSRTKEAIQLTVHLREKETKKTIKKIEGKMVLTPESEKSYVFQDEVFNPKLWSSEDPYLYEIVLELRDYKQQTIEVKAFDFGFREITLQDRRLSINGQPIALRGVNGSSLNFEAGCYLSKEDYHKGLRLLKQHNINVVGTSQYPKDIRFYELCNRYGIYVIDDGEVKTHESRNHGEGDADTSVDRMLVGRNYTCIIMWSLENEEMRRQGKALDESRPFRIYKEDQLPWLLKGDEIEAKAYDSLGIDPLNREHPVYQEIKKVYQTVKVTHSETEKNAYIIHNENVFISLKDIYLKWILHREGVTVQEGRMELDALGPQEEKEIHVAFDAFEPDRKWEYQLTLEFLTREATLWCPKDYCIGWEQFLIQKRQVKPSLKLTHPVEVKEVMRQIDVSGEDFELVLDKRTGSLKSYHYKDQPLLESPLIPSDLFDEGSRLKRLKRGTQQTRTTLLKIKDVSIQLDENICLIQFKGKHKRFKGQISLNYTISGKGQIVVEYQAVPKQESHRLGMQCKISEGYHHLTYYGKGPQENYCGQNKGARMGRYKGQVKEVAHDYVRPPERENYTDVLWFQLLNHGSLGIKISSFTEEYIDVCVWRDRKEVSEEVQEGEMLTSKQQVTVTIEKPHSLEKGQQASYQFLIEPVSNAD